MSKLTEDIQARIDLANEKIASTEHAPDEVDVVEAILSAHELTVEARVAGRRLKEGWQRKGVVAQLAVLEQAVVAAFHRAISG